MVARAPKRGVDRKNACCSSSFSYEFKSGIDADVSPWEVLGGTRERNDFMCPVFDDRAQTFYVEEFSDDRTKLRLTGMLYKRYLFSDKGSRELSSLSEQRRLVTHKGDDLGTPNIETKKGDRNFAV